MRLLILPLLALCQVARVSAETPDSIRVTVPENMSQGSILAAPLPDSVAHYEAAPSHRLPPPLFDGNIGPQDSGDSPFAIAPLSFYPGAATIAGWNSGAIYATGARSEYPGLAAVETGSLNFLQQFGRFSLSAHGDAIKTGYFRGLDTQWGFGGALSYQFNPNLSLTLFGNYVTGSSIANPAIRETLSVPSFGGYLNWRAGERWGVKVGARAQRSYVTRNMEVRPIVMPYVKIGASELGIDLVDILYQIITTASARRHHAPNPTIGPMRPGPPPVGPRN